MNLQKCIDSSIFWLSTIKVFANTWSDWLTDWPRDCHSLSLKLVTWDKWKCYDMFYFQSVSTVINFAGWLNEDEQCVNFKNMFIFWQMFILDISSLWCNQSDATRVRYYLNFKETYYMHNSCVIWSKNNCVPVMIIKQHWL